MEGQSGLLLQTESKADRVAGRTGVVVAHAEAASVTAKWYSCRLLDLLSCANLFLRKRDTLHNPEKSGVGQNGNKRGGQGSVVDVGPDEARVE
jgi:hypothetical protein